MVVAVFTGLFQAQEGSNGLLITKDTFNERINCFLYGLYIAGVSAAQRIEYPVEGDGCYFEGDF